METTSTTEQIKAIKQSFRMYMDVVTAQSLRKKGCSYKVIWGISLNHLQEIAQEYQPNYDLAVGLWQSDERECKLLATMLMPVKKFDILTAKTWMEEVETNELAEMLVFNLLQHLPYAHKLALEWLSSSHELPQLSAYNLYGRLFIKHYMPGDKESRKFLTCATKALSAENVSLRRSSMNSIIRFSELKQSYYEKAKQFLSEAGLDFL